MDSVIERSRKTTPTTGETEQRKTMHCNHIPYIKGTSERIARILRPSFQHQCGSQTNGNAKKYLNESERSNRYKNPDRNSLQSDLR